jgi:hypothetical protein
MNIYLDSYYKIGSTHKVCEDYALTGTYKDLNFAIVSDGCSACDEVDLGARMLSLIARETLRSFYDRGLLSKDGIKKSIKDIRYDIVRKMYSSVELLKIDPLAFSATLLMAVHIKNDVSFFLGWGDGYFIERNTSEIHIHKVEFESSAPFYLNYYPKDSRSVGWNVTRPNREDSLEMYRRMSQNNKVIVSEYLSCLGGMPKLIYEESKEPTEYYFFKVVEQGQRVHLSIASDGGGTFIRPSQKTKTPIMHDVDVNIIRDLVEYRKTKNNFAEKAYQRYLSENSLLEVEHKDDFSLATIVAGGVIRNTTNKSN